MSVSAEEEEKVYGIIFIVCAILIFCCVAGIFADGEKATIVRWDNSVSRVPNSTLTPSEYVRAGRDGGTIWDERKEGPYPR